MTRVLGRAVTAVVLLLSAAACAARDVRVATLAGRSRMPGGVCLLGYTDVSDATARVQFRLWDGMEIRVPVNDTDEIRLLALTRTTRPNGEESLRERTRGPVYAEVQVRLADTGREFEARTTRVWPTLPMRGTPWWLSATTGKATKQRRQFSQVQRIIFRGSVPKPEEFELPGGLPAATMIRVSGRRFSQSTSLQSMTAVRGQKRNKRNEVL